MSSSHPEEPASKKAKIDEENVAKPAAAADAGAAPAKHQSSLLNFFSSNNNSALKSGENSETTAASSPLKPAASKGDDKSAPPSLDPIVPTACNHITATWQSLHNQHVLYRVPNVRMGIFARTQNKEDLPHNHRGKIAAFDLDGTLLKWVSEGPGFWPSRLEHYELWNHALIAKLRALYDNENYRLVIFTNQGGIQKAHTGKRASLLKQLTEWLEQTVLQRPITVVASTRSLAKSQQSCHKPTPNMWNKVLVPNLPKDVKIDLTNSFFVGDSADEDDSQGGVDRKFARAVGIPFHTPDEYFGASAQELRGAAQQTGGGATDSPVPVSALQARQALLGGYLQGPIMIILCGVQGSGKSTFCQNVLGLSNDVLHVSSSDKDITTESTTSSPHWVWLSQDTISNGKPGKREKVEKEAQVALQMGNSVIVDRMHLDPEQRAYFVDIAKECKVPVHVVLLNPHACVVKGRVRRRTNHPGKVQGESGAKLAVASLSRLVLPIYDKDEGVDLISIVSTEYTANQLAARYRAVLTKGASATISNEISLQVSNNASVTMPAISLGTMGIGKRKCKEVVSDMLSAGFAAIDTAPTYKNEDKVGEALDEYGKREEVFVIAKVPKRAATADELNEELDSTLANLQIDHVDLLLLHWPIDVILQKTLSQVWKAMEECVKNGKAKALGVCNFNKGALMQLLSSNCTIQPVVNQIERHPLLPQWELVDFCGRNNIAIQAHTPLGQGNEILLENSAVQEVARTVSLTPAQVILRWNLQHGIAVVPKCAQEKHGKELLEVLQAPALAPEHMKMLDDLNKERDHRFVAPPFMYGTNVYCWGAHMPRK